MASNIDHKAQTTETPLSKALTAAVLRSGKRHRMIAREADVSERSLQRYLSGGSVPSYNIRNRVFKACGASPATCVLSSELGFDNLIGSDWHPYIDELVPQIYSLIIASSDLGITPMEPRHARRDARMVLALWEKVQRQTHEYLDRLAEEHIDRR